MATIETKRAGYQRWRTLLFLHWELPIESVRAKIPRELEIDTFDGRVFVGVVPFTMEGVRPWWSPSVPGVSNFHETNVRVYVKKDGVHGVWFFSLDAASSIAVRIARFGWHLPYHRATMAVSKEGDRVRYASTRRWPAPLPGDLDVDATVGGALSPPAPGSLEHFLVERYFLFAKKNDALYRGQVHHRPYPLHEARVASWRQSLIEAAGLPAPSGEPHVLYSPGVDVTVSPLERVG